MKERPILFSASMVLAILDGRKTQTRRLLKADAETLASLGKHTGWVWHGGVDGDGGVSVEVNGGTLSVPLRSPYGSTGDHLWVRETWAGVRVGRHAPVFYRASCADDACDFADPRDGSIRRVKIAKWRPSIFMPREASRITLEIAEVRVQRLQEVTAADACDEGAADILDPGHPLRAECYAKRGKWTGDEKQDINGPFAGAVDAFATLWDSVNGKRAPWATNPWVWCLTFRRIE